MQEILFGHTNGQGSILVRFDIAAVKHYDLKQDGEERAYLVYTSTS